MSTANDHPHRVGTVNRDDATKHTRLNVVSKDDGEQVVTGVVMVPHEVDRQGDFETPETVASFSQQFESLYENDDADGGIMHAAWPSEWMTLEANGIVGESFSDSDRLPDTVTGGAWAQSWRIEDDGLWQLIEDDVMGGFSIGARDVTWSDPMEQSDLPEGVGVPDEYPEDAPVYELVDGVIREVSAVDTPAVPDAVIHAKDDSEKSLEEFLGDRESFIEAVEDRGHSEEDAEAMWDVMTRASEVEGAKSPGKSSLYERIGRAAAKALPGFGGDDANGAESQTQQDTAKEGRTLSRANRESAMAAIDANLDLLEDAGMSHGMTRFTDREEYAFDLSEHTARSWQTPDGTDDDTDSDTEAMTNEDTDTDDDPEKNSDGDPFEDAPAWAKSLKDTVDANTNQLEELKADGEDDEDEDEDEDDDKNASEEAPEWAKALADQVEANAEAVESIGKQSGYSTQVRNQGQTEDGEKDASLASVLRSAGVQ
jgi:hypothetical protein